MIDASPTIVYDGHPDSPRLMFRTEDGNLFTREQWMLVEFMDRLEQKLDALTAALTAGGRR